MVHSGLGRATKRIRSELLRLAGIKPHAAYESKRGAEFADSMADDAVAAYAANVDLMGRLADAYGIETLFYFQPSIHFKPNRTEYERETVPKIYRCHQYEPLFRLFAERIQREPRLSENPRFHDHHLLFQDVEEPLFTDCFHMVERGNEIAANAMVDDVLAALERRASSR